MSRSGGRAYSDELKLLWTILDSVKVKAQHFLADGYYDSVKLIRYLEKEQIKCVIAISETIRQGVWNAYRKLVKGRYEDDRYYRWMYKRSRYKMEQLFGNVKLTWGDRDRTRIYELARLFVMVKFILWNLMVLLKLNFSAFSFVHYRIVVVCL